MAGSPSQLDLFDYKPKLTKHNGQPCPDELLEGRTLRLHQGRAEAARLAVQVRSARPVRRGDVGAAAASGQGRGRHHHHPLDAHDAVQPRAGADFRAHRPPGARPAEPGRRGSRTGWAARTGSARLRGAALRREQSRRRQVVLGQRLSADRLSGRAVPQRTASRCSSSPNPDGHRRETRRPVARCAARSERAATARNVGDPEIADAHRAVRAGLSACRRACRS